MGRRPVRAKNDLVGRETRFRGRDAEVEAMFGMPRIEELPRQGTARQIRLVAAIRSSGIGAFSVVRFVKKDRRVVSARDRQQVVTGRTWHGRGAARAARCQTRRSRTYTRFGRHESAR